MWKETLVREEEAEEERTGTQMGVKGKVIPERTPYPNTHYPIPGTSLLLLLCSV